MISPLAAYFCFIVKISYLILIIHSFIVSSLFSPRSSFALALSFLRYTFYLPPIVVRLLLCCYPLFLHLLFSILPDINRTTTEQQPNNKRTRVSATHLQYPCNLGGTPNLKSWLFRDKDTKKASNPQQVSRIFMVLVCARQIPDLSDDRWLSFCNTRLVFIGVLI